MWIFIVGDALLFAGFLAGYGFVRIASPSWPVPSEVFHLPLIALMTFILVSSGATMAAAVEAGRRGAWKTAVRLVLLTALAGAAFLGLQAYEWSELIHKGATLTTNPWNVPAFSASFYLITGFHGTHVLSGVLLLAIVAYRSATGKTKPEGLEVAGLYWAFVDLVWVFIFPLFYLIR
jgi:cytochrome c oxidase subunit 3